MGAGLAIELAAGCNLGCPSCPQGRGPRPDDAPALLDLSLLRRLLDHAARDLRPSEILLYNWGEPLLHPELPAAIRLVRATGAQCHLSTNLNADRDLGELLDAGPDSLRVSVSGFDQGAYGRGHRGGEIGRVKRQLLALRDELARTGARTRVHLYFHRYRFNLDDEPRLRALARQLGFGFHPVWALMMPAEAVLAYAEGHDSPWGATAAANRAAQDLIDELALPLDLALQAARRFRQRPCPFLDWVIPVDTAGRARLCCAVRDRELSGLGDFLALSPGELAARRRGHPLCRRCMHQGVHVYQGLACAEFERLAAGRIGPEYALRWYLRQERLLKRLSSWLPDRLRRSLVDLFLRASG